MIDKLGFYEVMAILFQGVLACVSILALFPCVRDFIKISDGSTAMIVFLSCSIFLGLLLFSVGSIFEQRLFRCRWWGGRPSDIVLEGKAKGYYLPKQHVEYIREKLKNLGGMDASLESLDE